MHPSTIRGSAARGFTLLELLVVVAIIALLAALVMGGVGMVKAQAKRVACASNQRQVGIAISSYATDCEGLVPRSAVLNSPLPPSTFRWSELLADYTATRKTAGGLVDLTSGRSVLIGCTAWRRDPINGSWKVGYGLTMNLDRPARFNATNRWDLANLTGNETDFLLSQLSAPTGRTLLMDSTDYMSLASDPPRHEGRSNALFCDLHVQQLNVTQISVSLSNPAALSQ